MTDAPVHPGRVWYLAARPRTLPAAFAPVLVGTATAQSVIAWRAAAALVVALSIQVGVNYANDYFDGVRGIDTAERVGPRRAVASGLVSPSRMKAAIAVALGIAGVAGAALAVAVGWELLVVGAVCFLAALGYSGGPRPYASAGLGEVFVFVFFGLVATVGSAYVQVEQIEAVAVVAAVPVGLLAVAILVANNLRDIPTDRAAGKRTLAVRLGDRATRWLYCGLVGGALLIGLVIAWPTVLSAPLAYRAARRVAGGATAHDLIPVLGMTGRLQLIFAVLLAAGLALA